MIQVSAAQVRGLGVRLRATGDRIGAHGLRSLADRLGDDAAAQVVAAAVRHAENDWSTQRRAIVTYLHTTGDAACGAAAAYRSVDDGVAHAADGGTR